MDYKPTQEMGRLFFSIGGRSEPSMSSYTPFLIPLAPLAATLVIVLCERWLGPKTYKISAFMLMLAFGVSLQILVELAEPGAKAIELSLFPGPQGSLFHLGLYIDRLSALMMTLISGIGALIALFSIRYLQQDPGRTRFFILLTLTTSALLCMVSSPNLMMLFIFWQLLSWFLFLLSHNYSHPATVREAFKTFTILRVGDVAFLSGIVLAYRLYGTLDLPRLFTRAAEVQTAFTVGGGTLLTINGATAVTFLIFVGAMSKSAQFPMHLWLPGALYAPTPVTALLHAGIINAGGFLLNRLAPLYGLSPATLHLAFAVGLVTTLLGASMMLIQNNIKMTLGFSTIGQMGYMIMECGLGAFALAIFHLVAHGLFKATVLLNCGNLIHNARQEPRLPPKNEGVERVGFSRLAWGTGFLTTLILPLIILLAAHGVLRIPLRDSQGIVIFLFFSWVTSSQSILTFFRLRAIGSWKVAAAMLLTLLLVVLTYLLAAEGLTHFLYPSPGEVARYFQAAALPDGLFDLLVGATALCIIGGWILIYAKTHGQTIRMPGWLNEMQVRLYVLFMNRLYLETLYSRLGQAFIRFAHRVDKRYLGWLP